MLASWFYSLWSHEKEVLVLGKTELRVECVEGKDFAELDIVSLSFYNLSAIPTPPTLKHSRLSNHFHTMGEK